MRKKIVAALVLILAFIAMPVQAQQFQTVEPNKAELLQEGAGKLYCTSCGMNLVMFYKTSHAIKHEDGTTHQYCSMHCLHEMNDQLNDSVKVVDTNSLKFMSVADAHYVVGSKVKGTMTMKSKYAFKTKAEAEAFQKEQGGEVMSFADASKIVRTALNKENEMIGKKRGMMAKKGEKIFSEMCQSHKFPVFTSFAEAKTYVATSGACGKLNDKQNQMLAVYLVKKDSMTQSKAQKIQVPEGAKCPVCGMFVHKYPKWAALIELNDGHKHYFDGAKDMMKFYFNPPKYHVEKQREDFSKKLVSDYYTLNAVDAEKAFFVAGSNVYGPMGKELVPFSSKEDAETFKKDHFGKEVMSFSNITGKLVADLDQ